MNILFTGVGMNPGLSPDIEKGEIGYTLVDFTGGVVDDRKDRPIVVFDLDDTIFDTKHRRKHLEGDKKSWSEFYDAAINDDINRFVCGDLVGLWDLGAQIILMTGRPDKYMFDTIRTLHKFDLLKYVNSMFMRHGDNYEPSTDLKLSMIKCLMESNPESGIVRFYDDDESVRTMVSKIGIEAIDPEMVGRQKLILPGQ